MKSVLFLGTQSKSSLNCHVTKVDELGAVGFLLTLRTYTKRLLTWLQEHDRGFVIPCFVAVERRLCYSGISS